MRNLRLRAAPCPGPTSAPDIGLATAGRSGYGSQWSPAAGRGRLLPGLPFPRAPLVTRPASARRPAAVPPSWLWPLADAGATAVGNGTKCSRFFCGGHGSIEGDKPPRSRGILHRQLWQLVDNTRNTLQYLAIPCNTLQRLAISGFGAQWRRGRGGTQRPFGPRPAGMPLPSLAKWCGSISFF